jgi:AmmeMemoRadiSam system protein A
MAPMPSAEPDRLTPDEREVLLDLALRSIEHGLDEGRALPVRPEDYPERLHAERATFVTLHRGGLLRGCIGHLEAFQPLVRDVADNAWAAAFRDPRFPPLGRGEMPGLRLHISVLSPPQPLTFDSEAGLLAQIRPGVDGLILQDGMARGTFLPSVWESLPRVEDFWVHLKRKAGLPARHWSATLRVFRYQTESFGAA